MRFPAFAAAALAVLVAPLAQAREVPGSAFSNGNWSGAAQTDPSGAFTHCSVTVNYISGEVLWMGLYGDDTLSVLFSHPDVRFSAGQTFDSWLMLEVGLPTRGTSEAWDQDFAGMTLEGVDASIAFLTQGQWLRLLGIGIDEAYDVTGITEALALARQCHAEQTGGSSSSAGPGAPIPKVPDILKPRTGTAGGGLGTRPGGALGTPAPKPAP